MSLRRNANAKHVAGVRSENYWEFRRGQRVMTREGFAGHVDDVEDGPYPGTENYRVTLEGGMGGGDYSASELRPMSGNTASGEHTAAEDYPELGTVLEDRPPLEHVKNAALASKCPECEPSTGGQALCDVHQLVADRHLGVDGTTNSRTGAITEDNDEGWFFGYQDGASRLPFAPKPSSSHDWQEGYEEGYRSGILVEGDETPYDPDDPHGFDLVGFRQKYAGIFDWLSKPTNVLDTALIGGGAYLMQRERQTQESADQDEIGPLGQPFHQNSVDWCRFRKNQRCFFPHQLDADATKRKGQAVWHAQERGFCWREDWSQQKACTVSEPGPDSGDPDALPYANVNGQVYTTKYASKTAVLPEIVMGDDLGFHLTASWADVQNKARRIRSDGRVRILSAADGGGDIVGEVEGDENVYQARLVRVPGLRTIASWECGCAWAAYSWGRTGRWRRYEGRMCSHALALSWEAQSRGMNGRQIREDQDTPHWMDGTIPVKQTGDWDRDKGRYSSLNTPDLAPAVVMAAELLSDDVDPAVVVSTLLPLGEHEARRMTRTALLVAVGYSALYQHQHVIFDFDSQGRPVVNGMPVNPQDLLYPHWDPSAGLGRMGAKETDADAMKHGYDDVTEWVEDGRPEQRESDLHDEPEPALPTTDGVDEDESVADNAEIEPDGDPTQDDPDDPNSDDSPADRMAKRQAGLAWLDPHGGAESNAGSRSGPGSGGDFTNADIAAAARQRLAAKTGAKQFTPGEQARIINEGADVRAGNFGDLNITGTHYEALDDMHALDEETLWP